MESPLQYRLRLAWSDAGTKFGGVLGIVLGLAWILPDTYSRFALLEKWIERAIDTAATALHWIGPLVYSDVMTLVPWVPKLLLVMAAILFIRGIWSSGALFPMTTDRLWVRPSPDNADIIVRNVGRGGQFNALVTVFEIRADSIVPRQVQDENRSAVYAMWKSSGLPGAPALDSMELATFDEAWLCPVITERKGMRIVDASGAAVFSIRWGWWVNSAKVVLQVHVLRIQPDAAKELGLQNKVVHAFMMTLKGKPNGKVSIRIRNVPVDPPRGPLFKLLVWWKARKLLKEWGA